jgi:hypothetical protein
MLEIKDRCEYSSNYFSVIPDLYGKVISTYSERIIHKAGAFHSGDVDRAVLGSTTLVLGLACIDCSPLGRANRRCGIIAVVESICLGGKGEDRKSENERTREDHGRDGCWLVVSYNTLEKREANSKIL